MTVIELYNKLCEVIPTTLSCPWDKDGLESCPEPDKEVKKILITLDITNAAIDRAIEGNFDVIVSHHPVFFGGLGVMNALTFDGAKAAIDLIYAPAESEFLRLAKERGVKTLNGEAMLFYQAYYADCLYLGIKADSQMAKTLYEQYKQM